MKKRLYITFAIISVATVISCSKKVESNYANPNSVNPPSTNLFAGYFTNMLYTWKLYVQDYGENWWEQDLGVGMYAQTHERYVTSRYSWYSDYADVTNGVSGNGFESSGESGIVSQWNSCYTGMKDWSTMQLALAGMSPSAQQDVVVYYKLGTLFKDVWCARLVDFWNKVPYFDAFKGNQGQYFPAYDDPKAIYLSILSDLQNLKDTLPVIAANMTPAGQSLFVNQDIAFAGNINQWVQYVNAVRLKLAVRISGVDPTDAQPIIADAIKNLPTTDCQFSNHTTDLPDGGGTWLRGVYESARISFVPNVIEKRMNFGGLGYDAGGVDDPRLPVICMPTKFKDYRGMTMNADTNEYYYNHGDTYYNGYDNLNNSLASNARSMYNIVTYPWNSPWFPAKMMTLAETDLFLAEVEAKGLASTGETAGDHVKDAVIHSCNYWYALNAGNANYRPDVPSVHPVKSDADIATYANTVKALFNSQTSLEGQMEIIMQQKYIHLNISDSYELWTELRRTRHPLLEPFEFGGVVMTPLPERLKYPSSELQTNQANYLKASADNNYTSPIFWVPSNKVGTSFYGTYLGAY